MHAPLSTARYDPRTQNKTNQKVKEKTYNTKKLVSIYRKLQLSAPVADVNWFNQLEITTHLLELNIHIEHTWHF